jgi:hypothetical protein
LVEAEEIVINLSVIDLNACSDAKKDQTLEFNISGCSCGCPTEHVKTNECSEMPPTEMPPTVSYETGIWNPVEEPTEYWPTSEIVPLTGRRVIAVPETYQPTSVLSTRVVDTYEPTYEPNVVRTFPSTYESSARHSSPHSTPHETRQSYITNPNVEDKSEWLSYETTTTTEEPTW